MKRMIGTVAAVALLASGAAYGQNTLPEIHQYFTIADAASFGAAGTGGLTTSPADWTTNPSINNALPGSSVYLAVWIRALRGDSPAPTQINAYNYEITGQGNLGSFSSGGGDNAHRRQRDLGGAYAPTPPAPGTGANYVDLPGVDSQMFGIAGAVSAAGTISDQSAGDANGAFLIQIIKIDIASGALLGDTLNVYFATPQSATANKYSTANTAASLNTIAFGATAAGGLDRKRASLPTADMVGTLADRVSTTPDAVIRVVPEPGTLGLVALGLLALRRRRAC